MSDTIRPPAQNTTGKCHKTGRTGMHAYSLYLTFVILEVHSKQDMGLPDKIPRSSAKPHRSIHLWGFYLLFLVLNAATCNESSLKGGKSEANMNECQVRTGQS